MSPDVLSLLAFRTDGLVLFATILPQPRPRTPDASSTRILTLALEQGDPGEIPRLCQARLDEGFANSRIAAGGPIEEV